MRCPGSQLVLDAPEETDELPCPNCGRVVSVSRYDRNIRRWPDAPKFVLKGHQYP